MINKWQFWDAKPAKSANYAGSTLFGKKMKIMLTMTNYAKKFLTGASPFALAKSIRCVNVLCVYINEKLIHGTALGTLAKTAE